jgi:hypothetical protein
MICEIKQNEGHKFAFEYLEGGCNENVNLYKNTAELGSGIIALLP